MTAMFETGLVTAHREWSDETFGDKSVKGPIGPLKHLSKEALEAAAQPDDIFEFADCAFLLLDSLHRAGFSFDDLNRAMREKLDVLKGRDYSTNQVRGSDEAVQHADKLPTHPLHYTGK